MSAMLVDKAAPVPATNAPEWSVSDLANALRRTLEEAFGHVRLRGEISGYRGPHGSGHVYFSLKDQDACIDAVIWRSTFSKLRFKPQEGLEVIATGRVTTFAGKSKYQIIIESLHPAPARRPLPASCAGLAGPGPGRDLGRGGRGGDPRLQCPSS